jgi:hypothetical protein
MEGGKRALPGSRSAPFEAQQRRGAFRGRSCLMFIQRRELRSTSLLCPIPNARTGIGGMVTWVKTTVKNGNNNMDIHSPSCPDNTSVVYRASQQLCFN